MAEKKTLKAIETLRELDEKALIAKVAELRKSMVEQQRAKAAQELPSTAVIAKTRKEIAQALTVLRQKQTEAKKEEK